MALRKGSWVIVTTVSRWGERQYRARLLAKIPSGVAIEEVLPPDRSYPRGVVNRSQRVRALVVTEKNELKVPLWGKVRPA